MSEKPSKDPRRGHVRDERDEDSELVPPPPWLVAGFLIPLLLLVIWAFAQG